MTAAQYATAGTFLVFLGMSLKHGIADGFIAAGACLLIVAFCAALRYMVES